jgi:SAM-dependent methyltransferase
MNLDLNEAFWDNRYKTNDTGWDLGNVSMPIKTYIDQLKNKKIKILIPGCGNSYEAEYLYNKGFKNVYLIDISETALSNFKKRVPNFPISHLIHKNYFDLKTTFDLIIEQTFFCAINPNLRLEYAQKGHQLLNKKGKIVGLLFKAPLNDDHPPFGGNKEEYESYFKPYFHIKTMSPCYNSESEREGKELFFNLLKK